MTYETVEWRAILGYEGLYEVSSLGEVRRRAGVDSLGRPRAERLLSRCDDGRGYFVVTLSKGDTPKMARVHVLVAEAFHGARKPGEQVNHMDGRKHNNAADNLEWCSHAENMRHSSRNGLHASGDRHGMVKIGPEIATKIRRLYSEGQTSTQIAKLYPIHPSHVLKIVQGKHW